MNTIEAHVLAALQASDREGAEDQWLTRCPLWAQALHLGGGEICYAAYENHPGTPQDSVVATTCALYLRRSAGWECIPYPLIDRVTLKGEQEPVASLSVWLKGGREVVMRMPRGEEHRGEVRRLQQLLDQLVRDSRRVLQQSARSKA